MSFIDKLEEERKEGKLYVKEPEKQKTSELETQEEEEGFDLGFLSSTKFLVVLASVIILGVALLVLKYGFYQILSVLSEILFYLIFIPIAIVIYPLAIYITISIMAINNYDLKEGNTFYKAFKVSVVLVVMSTLLATAILNFPEMEIVILLIALVMKYMIFLISYSITVRQAGWVTISVGIIFYFLFLIMAGFTKWSATAF